MIIKIVITEFENGAERKPVLTNIRKFGRDQGILVDERDNESCTLFRYYVSIGSNTHNCCMPNRVSTIVMVAEAKVWVFFRLIRVLPGIITGPLLT